LTTGRRSWLWPWGSGLTGGSLSAGSIVVIVVGGGLLLLFVFPFSPFFLGGVGVVDDVAIAALALKKQALNTQFDSFNSGKLNGIFSKFNNKNNSKINKKNQHMHHRHQKDELKGLVEKYINQSAKMNSTRKSNSVIKPVVVMALNRLNNTNAIKPVVSSKNSTVNSIGNNYVSNTSTKISTTLGRTTTVRFRTTSSRTSFKARKATKWTRPHAREHI
jgi:hypothetical protein